MEEKRSFLERNVKIIVVLAVLAGSSSGIFGRAIEAPAMATGFFRLSFGFPFFAIPVLCSQKKRKELFSVKPKELFFTFLSGAFLFGHFFSWFTAVKMTQIPSAAVLAALHPLVVLLVTVFVFKRRVSRGEVIGIVVALAGGTMVAGFDLSQLSAENFAGDILAFMAALFMGLYFLIGNEVRKKVSGEVYVSMVFFACWVCFAVGMLVTDTHIIGYRKEDYLLMAGLTIVCQIGAHAVFNLCFGYVDSLYVSVWESGESVFAIFLSMVLLRELPKSWEIFGCIIVVAGLMYYNISAAKFQQGTNGEKTPDNLK